MAKLSVLIVEDSEALREELIQTFENLGFETLFAEDGKAAWLYLQDLHAKKKLPHLVASDVTMPHMDGVQLLTKVRNDKSMKDLPFLIFTSSKDELFKMTALCLSVNAYLLKPIDVELLKKEIRKIFPSHQL